MYSEGISFDIIWFLILAGEYYKLRKNLYQKGNFPVKAYFQAKITSDKYQSD